MSHPKTDADRLRLYGSVRPMDGSRPLAGLYACLASALVVTVAVVVAWVLS